MDSLEIGLIVLIVIVLIIEAYYVYSTSSKAASTVVTPTTYTYTTVPDSLPISPNIYPPCPNSADPNYCILPHDQAIAQCNADPNCAGLAQPTGNPKWLASSSFNNGYQLFSTEYAMHPTSIWTAYVKGAPGPTNI
jgi:hypothetical protein